MMQRLRTTARLAGLGGLAAWATLACGGSVTPLGDTTEAPDLSTLEFLFQDPGPRDLPVEAETWAEETWDIDESSPDLPPALVPCTQAGDCETGFCVNAPGGGRVCAPGCLGGECPDGWACRQVGNIGGDAVFVCLPRVDRLCRPCATHADCRPQDVVTADLCVPFGAGLGSFCGQDCGAADCPAGYECRDVSGEDRAPARQCLPASGTCACDAAAVQDGVSTPCSRTNGFGTCPGVRKCTAGGLTDCDAPAPTGEACNGRDDDCDGQTDEEDAAGCAPWYADRDGDGYGLAGDSKCLCTPVPPYSSTLSSDCDDGQAGVHPGVPEACNAVDDDCDGATDPDGTEGCSPYLRDGDGDGWGVTGDAKCLCAPQAPYTATQGGDCDDQAAVVHPTAAEVCGGGDEDCDETTDEPGATGCVLYYPDADKDGWGDPAQGACLCAPDGDRTVTNGGDCNDQDLQVHPGAGEACGQPDTDCDGLTDEPDAPGCSPFHADADGDGSGDAASTACLCAPTAAFPAVSADDCDDTDPAVFPGALETCNGRDDDCDGETDEAGAGGCLTRYADRDGDGAGDPLDAACRCAPEAPYLAAAGDDCNDTDPAVRPGAAEGCNGVDDDCNGIVDDPDAKGCKVFFRDDDGDGWGVGSDFRCLCAAAGAYSTRIVDDCNDADPAVNPVARETCNGKDDNCDGITDPTDPTTCLPWYFDGDGDGHGDPAKSQCTCAPSGSFSAAAGDDCDDMDGTVHPGAVEVCNGRDDDCDGQKDQTFACFPGQAGSQACGTCGTQPRTCTDACEWGEWGACQGEGACTPGQQKTQPCGSCGTQVSTCTAQCQWSDWGACQGQGECSPGAQISQGCGACGTQWNVCDSACHWTGWGSCNGQGACYPGQTQQGSCDRCSQQVCGGNCQWGGCGLKPGSQCEWWSGTHWRCCGSGGWQFCLSSCVWSTQCSYCADKGCGCP